MDKTTDYLKTQVRFPQDMWNEIKRLADKHERSSNGEIVFAMREYITWQKKKEKYAHASESSTCVEVIAGDLSSQVLK